MLKGLFDLDNPVMRFLSRVADLLLLNLLFIVCSIPVFTIGASTSALYYCFFKMKDEEEGYLTRKFFHSFKENFKQATVMWLIMLVFLVILVFELLMFRDVGGNTGFMVRAVVLVGLIFWFLIYVYSFALLSRFYNSIGNTFRNAVLLLFGNGPRTIAIGILFGFMIYVTISQQNVTIFWNILLFWILFAFSLDAFLNVQLLYPLFKKLMPEESAEETAPDNQFTVDEETDLSALGYTPLPPREGEAEDVSAPPES